MGVGIRSQAPCEWASQICRKNPTTRALDTNTTQKCINREWILFWWYIIAPLTINALVCDLPTTVVAHLLPSVVEYVVLSLLPCDYPDLLNLYIAWNSCRAKSEAIMHYNSFLCWARFWYHSMDAALVAVIMEEETDEFVLPHESGKWRASSSIISKWVTPWTCGFELLWSLHMVYSGA